MVLSISRFSVVLIDSQWFSVVSLVGSRRFSMVLVGSQWFLVVLVASQWFSVVLTGSRRFRSFSMVLSVFRLMLCSCSLDGCDVMFSESMCT